MTLDATGPSAAIPLRRSFRQGMLVSALNPRIALFFVAFLLIALAIDVGYALARRGLFGGGKGADVLAETARAVSTIAPTSTR